ncbi:MAG: ABC transporter permease [Tepidiformaceae bacterium]
MHGIWVILKKELRDAVQSRWLVAFAAAFALVALAISQVQGATGSLTDQGFNRTTAGLINLCMLLVPLLALVLGAASIASERERGTLAMLLSQPISATELLIGKYLGLTVAVWLAIALGFGAGGMLIALFGPLTDVGHYALFMVLAGVLASSMLSIGMLISVASDSRLKAMSLAILAWFGFVFVYDLGAIALLLSVSASGESLLLAILGNPVEAVRVLAILSLEPDMDVLGPLGSYLSDEFGVGVSAVLLLGALALWTAAPLTVAATLFAGDDV